MVPNRHHRCDLRKRDSGGSLESSALSDPTVVRSPPHRTGPPIRRDRSTRTAAWSCGVRTTVEGAGKDTVVVSHHHRRHPQRGCRFGTPVHPGLSRGSGGHGDAHTSTVRLIGAVVKRQIPCPTRDSATSGDSQRQPWTTNANQQRSPMRCRLSMCPTTRSEAWSNVRGHLDVGIPPPHVLTVLGTGPVRAAQEMRSVRRTGPTSRASKYRPRAALLCRHPSIGSDGTSHRQRRIDAGHLRQPED